MKKQLIIIIILLLIITLVGQSIFWPKKMFSDEEIQFRIIKGQSSKEIAKNLESQGIIKNDWVFWAYAWLKGESDELKSGTYVLSPSMPASKILDKIVSGDTLKEKLTIIEGWNLRDLAWHFENRGMFQAEELMELAGFPPYAESARGMPGNEDFSKQYDFLSDKPKNITLEGFLFPDTYLIDPEATLKEIVEEVLLNFNEKLTPDLRAEIKNQNKSIFEIITMASLLEKEVRTYDDKQMVAGVLWKRLEINMPLQVDATITYLTAKKTTQITKNDLAIDSPYNTYQYFGLPLGPIANPGIDSVKAAIYPKSNGFWYYLSTPEGETIFSETLEQHNTAKVKYLK